MSGVGPALFSHSSLTIVKSAVRFLLLSSVITSIQYFFGLPLFLFPSMFLSKAALEGWVLSRLCTCPNHLSRLDLRNSSIGSVFVIFLIYSFLILSSLVLPHIHLSIFISATASLLASAAFMAHIFPAYVIDGQMMVWYSFCFSFCSMFLS